MTEPSHLASTPGDIIEFRPAPEQASRATKPNLIAIAILGPVLLVTNAMQVAVGNTVLGFVGIGIVVVGFPLALLLGRRAAKRSLLRFGDGNYEARQGFTTRKFGIADVHQIVVLRSARFWPWPGAPMTFIVGPTKRLTTLSGFLWNADQLDAVAQDIAGRGVPLVDHPETLTAAQLRRIDRRWITWWEAHPIAIGAGAGLAIVIIVTVTVLVAFAVLR